MWWIFGLFGFMYIAASSFSGVSALIVLMIGATVGVLTRIFGKASNESETQVVKNLKQTIAELEARLGKVENVVRALMKKNYASASQVANQTAQATDSETTPERNAEQKFEVTASAPSAPNAKASDVLAPLEFHTNNPSNIASSISSSNSSSNTANNKEDINKKDVSHPVVPAVALASASQANANAVMPSELRLVLDVEPTKEADSNAIAPPLSSSEQTQAAQQVISATPIISNVDASLPAQNIKIPTQNRQAIKPRPPSKSWREILPAPISNFLFGGNALVKVGVLILFLGFAFLLRYTAERVTVPIELRYVSVLLSGVGLLALGWFLRHKRRDYALIMQGMAIGVFYLTILSAMKMHQLISYEAGFAFMLAVSLLSAALSVLQKAPMLAIVAALEGFITPILTSTGENKPLGLFLYLSILDIGIFCIAWFNAWRVLNVIAFVGTFTLSLGWAHKHYTHAQYGITQVFLLFFFLLFTLIGVLFARRTLLEARGQMHLSDPLSNTISNTLATPELSPLSALKQVGRVDSALVFGTPITAFGLQYILMQPFEYGAAISALFIGFFYFMLGRLVFSKEKQGLALLAESYVIIAAIFASLAIPLGLEGAWTSSAWAIEGAGMYWLGIRQARPYARAFAFMVLVGASVKLLFALTLSTIPMTPLIEGALLGPLLLAISAFVMWHLYRHAAANAINLDTTTSLSTDSSSAASSTAASLSSATANQVPKWEAPLSVILPWIGMIALSCLPWMLLMPGFASAAVAVMAVGLSYVGVRYQLPHVRTIAAVMQGFALLSFLQTLHLSQTPEVGAPLTDGWRGMIAAIIIAVSILLNAARHMLQAKRIAQEQGLPPNWSWKNGIAVVTAAALLHVAMLFVLEYSQVAWIWPFTSCLVLWAGLKMSHIPLVSFSFFLQALSVLLYRVFVIDSDGAKLIDTTFDSGVSALNSVELTPLFSTPLFIVPLSLALAAWWCADRLRLEVIFLRKTLSALLHNASSNESPNSAHFSNASHNDIASSPSSNNEISSRQFFNNEVSTSKILNAVKQWTNAWCDHPLFQWGLVIWGLVCWLGAWLPEIENALSATQHTPYLMSAYVVFAIATSGLMLLFAKYRDWQEMGAASIVGLGIMIAAAWIAYSHSINSANSSNNALNTLNGNAVFLPSMFLGWLAWPLALAWHSWSMRLQQQWLVRHDSMQNWMHIIGFWLFLILAASEVQVRLSFITEPGTSWALLGWILVPAIVLWLIGSKALAQRWPLQNFRAVYIERACTPVAIYLFMWCCISNVSSAGNPSPLPYVSLFNPLELAQGLIMIGLLWWWRHLSANSIMRRSEELMTYVMAVTAFTLLTGSVLRSVHHYAGVSWDADALFDSRLAQAALSITWAICGVALMLIGNRKISRSIWMAGASLLGIVVVKLFLIELADQGGLYRIISFIGVGIALLVVGYFAPVPVKKVDVLDTHEEEQ